MPQIKKAAIKRVYFPSTKDESNEADKLWMDIKTTLTAENFFAIDAIKDENEMTATGIMAIAVGWNATDEDGKLLPIDRENLGKINYADFGVLSAELVAVILSARDAIPTEEKKTLSDTLTPSTPAAPQM